MVDRKVSGSWSAGRSIRIAIVVAYVGVIYTTIPYAPKLWLWLSHATGVELTPLALAILLSAGLGAMVVVLWRSARWSTALALGIVATLYVAIYQSQFEAPAERLHLLEYGLLPGLVIWALDSTKPPAIAGAFCAAVFTGALDEGIQALTPGRVAQLHDIVLNVVSVTLGMLMWGLAHFSGARPSDTVTRPRPLRLETELRSDADPRQI